MWHFAPPDLWYRAVKHRMCSMSSKKDFFADFLAGFFLLIFVGKSAQKNPPGKSPGNPPNFIQQKSSSTFLQIGRGNNFLHAVKKKTVLFLNPLNKIRR